ncbi:MAG: CBS domain-containing protein [Halanaeroarchaeum sp.]
MPELTLRDVMTREFLGVSESDSVAGAVELMREEGVQSAVVVRGTEPIGTIDAGDVLDRLAESGSIDSVAVEEVMQRDPPTVDPSASLSEVASSMMANDADLVLVADEEGPLGVVTARDLARYPIGRNDVDERVETVERTIDGRDEAVEGYSDQSICEACGSLSRDLVNVNGQLLCPDCREV